MTCNNKVKSAILAFLKQQKLKKLEPEHKKLAKTADPDEIAKLNNTIQEIEDKYQFENWIAYAANVYANQLKFGTHISKGIHPDAKGDNVTFQPQNILNSNLVGSQNIPKLELDANGNAAALPLASFFNILIEEENKTKLKDLLLNDDSSLEQCFSDTPSLSLEYKTIFQRALKGDLDNPTTHEKNKQILWANNEEAIIDNSYTCLIPLYPSSLTYHFYNKINQARYSDENKTARENRRKKTELQSPYISINQLAITKLGGTKPQNVSQLTSAQGGRNYLLPSLPPIISSASIKISLTQTTIFNARLAYACRYGLRQLYESIQETKNIYTIRKSRFDALNIILQTVLRLAKQLQAREVNWTKDYQLDWCEKYWLDPNCWQNDELHSERYQKQDWIDDIEKRFALWINACLKKKFPKISTQFNDPEYQTWRKQFKKVLRLTLRHQ